MRQRVVGDREASLDQYVDSRLKAILITKRSRKMQRREPNLSRFAHCVRSTPCFDSPFADPPLTEVCSRCSMRSTRSQGEGFGDRKVQGRESNRSQTCSLTLRATGRVRSLQTDIQLLAQVLGAERSRGENRTRVSASTRLKDSPLPYPGHASHRIPLGKIYVTTRGLRGNACHPTAVAERDAFVVAAAISV